MKLKGSFTVEMAIIFPFIIVIVMFSLYFSYFMMMRTALLGTVTDAINKAAEVWQNPHQSIHNGELITEQTTVDVKKLYWELLNTEDNMDRRVVEIQNTINENYFKGLPLRLQNDHMAIEIEMKNYIYYKVITAKVHYTGTSMFKGVKELLFLDGDEDIFVYVQSQIKDPAQVIRNVDLAAPVVEAVVGKISTAEQEITTAVKNEINNAAKNLVASSLDRIKDKVIHLFMPMLHDAK